MLTSTTVVALDIDQATHRVAPCALSTATVPTSR